MASLTSAPAGPVPGSLSPDRRAADLVRLADEQLDVLVIGGGVTGVGCALDAATRGLKVGLVEQRDLASGTSSRSSKLLHGGLRYLEQRDFARQAVDIKLSSCFPRVPKRVPIDPNKKPKKIWGVNI